MFSFNTVLRFLVLASHVSAVATAGRGALIVSSLADD